MNTAQTLIYIEENSPANTILWGLVIEGLDGKMEQGGAVWRFADGSAVAFVGAGICEYIGG